MPEVMHWKRNIAFFLAGQAVSLIGSSLVGFAIMWYVTIETGSGTMMTVFTVAVMLPMFFIAPFGGVWADRFNRKLLIIIADGFIAIVTLIIAISFSLGVEHLGILLICSVARSLGQGVQMPAISSLIPQIVPQEQLLRINGINTTIQSISMLGTPALAGVFLSLFPIQTLLFIDVFTATGAILILLFLVKVPNPKDAAAALAEKAKPMLADLKDGLLYIKNHLFLKRFFIVMACFVFLLAPAALLTPLQVTRNFGAEYWLLTVIEIAFSAGMAAGGLLMSTWGGFKNKTFMIGASFVLMAVMSVGIGVTKVFPLYTAFMVVIGISAATSNTPALTILQQKVEPAYMGRVVSVWTMIVSLVMPVGIALFGPLADRVSLDTIIIVTGALVGVLGVYIFADKELKEAGRPLDEDG
ncbi:MAG: MFS transporter [Clostridiales bacterium]|nr:MFS transporter [Clostridiales bacterium]